MSANAKQRLVFLDEDLRHIQRAELKPLSLKLEELCADAAKKGGAE